MVTDIAVHKDGKEIWAGRVLSENEDFYRNRVLTCEGELAFFNDSTQPPAEYAGGTIREYLEAMIAIHNAKVGDNRKFTIGIVTVVDEDFPTYYTNYEKTITILNALVAQYLSVYGLTVTNGVRTTFAVDSSGSVTIDGKVTLSAGSTINWASVTNQNLTSNPAYSLASTANANAATAKSAADDAYDEASAAWSRANKAYQDRCTDQNVFDVLTSGGTKFGIFSDSYSGRLYINADYIRSGTINADYIDLSCDYGGFCKGHGSDGQHTTYGAMMYGSNGPGWEPYIIVTNAGARISGTGADLVVSGGITMSEEPSYGSDLRIKNSIDYDLASYEAFFLALKPSTFKYNKGTSGRKHFGFIAQDVEQAMLDTGLMSDQLAALVKDPVKEILSDGITDYRYSIRYGELIALNTHMIQKLYQMVEELLQQKEG